MELLHKTFTVLNLGLKIVCKRKNQSEKSCCITPQQKNIYTLISKPSNAKKTFSGKCLDTSE